MPKRIELPADFPIAASLSARRTPTRRTKQYADDACPEQCADGKQCASTTKFAHFWHLCRDEQCTCRRALRQVGSGVAR